MKTTKHTFNKIVKKDNLFIKVNSSFNGMIDGCEYFNNGFEKAERTEHNLRNTYGINGAWLVGGGRDYFELYEDENITHLSLSQSRKTLLYSVYDS